MAKHQQRSINEINQQTITQHMPEMQTAQMPPVNSRKPYGKDDRYTAGYPQEFAYEDGEAVGMSRGKKIAIIILCALLAVLIAAGTAVALYLNGVFGNLNKGNKSDAELLAIEDALGGYKTNFNDVFYMLLIGYDARPGETMSRSDTNIVVRVDPKNNNLNMLSIPRDTKIDIPGHGTQKFNVAYALDKVPGVINATEALLGIKISHYAEVSFLDLKNLVDAVGGVTIENESVIDDPHCDDGDGNHYIIPAGTQRLDGGQALTFARTRHYATGDFIRTSHQRQLVEALIQEILHLPITKIPDVITAASKCVTTDINIFDIIGLAQQFADTNGITVFNAMLPSYTQNINGISFVINDTDKTLEMMELFKKGLDPSEIVSTKSAPDISTSSIDTSKTIILDDDTGAVPSSSASSSASSAATSSSSAASSASSSAGTSSGGAGDTPGSVPSSSAGTDNGTSSGGGSGTGSGTGAVSGGGSGSGGGSTSGETVIASPVVTGDSED